MLVETEWVAACGSDPNLCLVEVDVDTSAYEQGHIAGAIGWNWRTDTQDQLSRDIDAGRVAALMQRSGIGNDTTVILYGDNNNWFAAYALWMMKYYGHADVRLMNGSRAGGWPRAAPTTTDTPEPTPCSYTVGAIDKDLRALRPFVEQEPEQHRACHGRRALARRVLGQAAGAGRAAAGGRAARRAHPRRGQYPVGHGGGCR